MTSVKSNTICFNRERARSNALACDHAVPDRGAVGRPGGRPTSAHCPRRS
ncbi:hypothetical protein L083_2724 [Actinoplanes sp. N902-109]|nr:hypothetical protein L083_2724 [Actinoplanes sp. N902-109]